MKKLAIFAVVIVLCAGLWQYAQPIKDAIAAEQIVMVNLVQPIEIQKSVQTGAKFQELTQEAMKFGMGDVILNGHVTYAPQADSSTRSTIIWDSISMQSGGLTLSEPLGSALQSMVRTQQPEQAALNRIEPGTILKAKGDVQTLAEALGRLKQQMDEKTKPIVEKSEKVEKTNVAPVVAATQDNPQQTTTAGGTPFNTTIEAGTTTTTEKCADKFIDISKMKAFAQYKAVYTKAGVKTGEGVCTPNQSEFSDIQAKNGNCTYAFDLANSTATKQEQWYYMDGSTEVLVGTCRDSSTKSSLTESRTGCPVTTDLVNKKVFPQSKLVFKIGTYEDNATECRAVTGATGIPINEEACEPMFEHDFTNHVSYLLTRLYYTSDVDGSKVYISSCGRSSTVSFLHVEDTTSCGWDLDDNLKVGYQKAKTIIKTGTLAGDVVIMDCKRIATIPYADIGIVSKTEKFTTKGSILSGSYTFPTGLSSASILLVSAGSANYRAEGCAAGNNGQAGVYELDPVSVAGKTAQYYLEHPVANDQDAYGAPIAGTVWLAAPPREANVKIGTKTYRVTTPEGPPIGASCAQGQGYVTTGRFGINNPDDYPSRGVSRGWGCGAPTCCSGLPAGETFWWFAGNSPYVSGLPGIIAFEYSIKKWLRPDGTIYIPTTPGN